MSTPSAYHRTPATTIAGLCYVAVIAGGLFAEGAVRQSLIVSGDPVATARAIAESESLWRLGIAVHLLYLIPGLTMKVIVSGLFREAEPTIARLTLVFGVSAVTIEAMSLVFLTVPVASVAGQATLIGVADAPTLVHLATQLFATGFAFSLVLFAGFCVGVGVLILRVQMLPRVIGAMMILAGILYVLNTLALLVAPAFAAAVNPAILLPIVIAEASLALWLLAKGIATPRA